MLSIVYLVTAPLLLCLVSTSPLPQSSVHVKFFSPTQNYEHGIHSYSTVGAAGVVPSSPAFTKQFLPRYQPSYLLPQPIQNRGARTLAVHPNQRRVLATIDSDASSPTGAFLEPNNDIRPLLELDTTYEQPYFTTNKLQEEEEEVDPLLLTGDAAREAVKYLFGRGALYWDQIPHSRALERNQEERRANGLPLNRLSSNRIESPYFRGGRPYREPAKNRQRSFFLY